MVGERSRYRGSLLGLAVGDALGTTLEFSVPGRFEPISDMVGGGPFGLEPGQWTDDTSMALCLAESILEAGWDPVDQLTRYVRWMRDGHLSSTGRCFDIGQTVLRALGQFQRTGEAYCGSTDPYSAGNGSMMRLAPVALRFAHDREEAVARAAESSRTTHGAATAVDACRYLAALIVGALEGRSKDELLASDLFGDAETIEIGAVAAGSFHAKEPPAIRGSGYVVESLEAAL
jgi:ADP-ribosyl-[dinitrogen reductase] hydrolase